MSSKKLLNEFTKGIIKENPVLILMVGLCSVLAVSTEVKNAIGMGSAMTFVLLGSNILVSFLRNSIPNKVRIPVFLIIIGSFTTIVDLVMNAYAPAIHKNLGIFIPLIVVNCIIIARAEAFAAKNPVLDSAMDALGIGFGYALVLFVIATIREILGNGTFFGVQLFTGFNPVLIMMLPPGAFITIGLLMAILRSVKK
ncbi:MAG: electron transport complex subunit RsxE [Elusimicrobia bacterium CG06_land_8_20_14_3_00_38_11]|nr:MAG: electron transport complex subunit RsxE [Elusimicrobia bacterium CG06_land_8_20_14_3_00_38_11]